MLLLFPSQRVSPGLAANCFSLAWDPSRPVLNPPLPTSLPALALLPFLFFSFPLLLLPSSSPPPTPLNQSPSSLLTADPPVYQRVIAFLHSCKSARLIFFISSRSFVTFFPVASLPGCPGNSSRLRRSFELATLKIKESLRRKEKISFNNK